MTITDAITELCFEYLSDENDWYSWRRINESKIPGNITLPEGNQYLKNIYLKKALHEKWINEPDLNKKGEFIEYYIKDWGGIKGNKKYSMGRYRTLPAKELISIGIKGVASWSKALVVHDPNKYAILDARVSCALNCIQLIFNIDDKVLFPILPSRNEKIKEANKLIKQISKQAKWKHQPNNTFYANYLSILYEVAIRSNSDISTIEMFLFIDVLNLVNEIYGEF